VHEVHKKEKKVDAKIAIFVVSTSRYQAIKEGKKVEDVSGDIAKELLRKHGFEIVNKEIIRDGILSVKDALNKALKEYNANVIIFIGGTGISGSDLTIDVIENIIDKELMGFGEIFRSLSFKEIGSSAIMSRALLGVYNKSLIACLPGSPNAVKLALEQILIPEIYHILNLLHR